MDSPLRITGAALIQSLRRHLQRLSGSHGHVTAHLIRGRLLLDINSLAVSTQPDEHGSALRTVSGMGYRVSLSDEQLQEIATAMARVLTPVAPSPASGLVPNPVELQTQADFRGTDLHQCAKHVGSFLALLEASSFTCSTPCTPTIRIALQKINLSNCMIGQEGAAGLAKMLSHCHNLLQIDLSFNALTDTGMRLLAPVLSRCRALRFLRLDANDMGTGCNLLFQEILNRLTYSGPDDGRREFQQSRGCRLEVISLVGNRIADKDLRTLCEVIRYKAKQPTMSDRGHLTVEETCAAERPVCLRRIDLAGNPLSWRGLEAVTNALRDNTHIASICVQFSARHTEGGMRLSASKLPLIRQLQAQVEWHRSVQQLEQVLSRNKRLRDRSVSGGLVFLMGAMYGGKSHVQRTVRSVGKQRHCPVHRSFGSSLLFDRHILGIIWDLTGYERSEPPESMYSTFARRTGADAKPRDGGLSDSGDDWREFHADDDDISTSSGVGHSASERFWRHPKLSLLALNTTPAEVITNDAWDD